MARVAGWLGWGLVVLLGAVLALAGVAYYVLAYTQDGQDLVLDVALEQVNQRIDGRVEVEAIRSDGLLRGLALHGLTIRDGDERLFAQVDSLAVGYRVRDVLRGQIRLEPVDVWDARVILEELPGRDRLNVERIFTPDRDPDEPDDPLEEDDDDLRLALARLGLHNVDLELRFPSPPDDEPFERLIVESFPGLDDGLMQRLTFREIHGRVPLADILEPGRDGERFEVESLTTVAEILEEPFTLEDFRGDVRRSEDRVDVMVEELRLPSTRLSGEALVDYQDPISLEARVDAPEVALADFRWAIPELPEVEGSVELTAEGPVDRGSWNARNADLRLEGSRVTGHGGVRLGEELVLQDVDVMLEPVELAHLEPWMEEPLPVEGRIRGPLQLDGPFRDLATSGVLTLEGWGAEDARPVTADVRGRLHLDEPLGATGATVLVDPLDYRLLSAFHEELATVRGEGRLFLEGGGRWGEGLEFSGDALHGAPDLPRSEVTLQGRVQGTGEEMEVELDAMLDPLSLTTLSSFYPDVPFRGDLTGSVGVAGPLRDLETRVVLATPGGPFQGRARFDMADPGAHYEAEASVRDFALDRLVPDLPDPTIVTGEVSAQGQGTDPATMAAEASASIGPATVGHTAVDSITARASAAEGRLNVEALDVWSAVGNLTGWGDLALVGEAPSGELELEWETESLEGLRVLATGDTVAAAADTLTPLEEDILRWEGVDPDTLPGAMGGWDGRARGGATVAGSLERFQVDGFVDVEDAVLGEHAFQRAHVAFQGRDLPGEEWRGDFAVAVDSVETFARSFRSVEAEGDFGGSGQGRARATVERDDREEYRVAGDVRLVEGGGEVTLEELHARFDDLEDWYLEDPTRFRWSSQGVEVDDLRLARTGAEPMHLRAHGFLPRRGGADFRLDLEGLRLARVARSAQWDAALGGRMAMHLAVTGTADAPRMEGTVAVDGLSYEDLDLGRVEGDFGYRDRRLRGDVAATDEGRGIFRAGGWLTADLAFRPVEDRFPDEAMDLRFRADSVPAGLPVALLEVIQDVEGVVEGEIQVAGTPGAPEPGGALRLREGAASFMDLGIRTTGVELDLEMDAERRVKVSGEAHARGGAVIGGTIDLDDFTDPGFDLQVRATGFQALNRPDLEARLGGTLALTGRYTRPEVTGDLRVDQGTIHLEEFQRTADVVDLADPAFFDVVDTTLVAARPVVAAVQNPFVQNLRVGVDVTATRDVWLRSREMNVEMGGDLIVTFDRPAGELVMTGTLQAIRGSYTAFGRNFQVREGTVEFPGTPGINPTLDIEAVNRLRREGGEPLDVVALVEGTLMNPRVSLTSDAEPPIAQSDLISYLIFGRPSYALGRGETSILEGAAGAGVTLGLGTLATQLGTIFAREIGLDYIAITQQQGLGLLEGRWGGFGGQFAQTQVELGQYLGQDVFVAVMLRPLTGLGAGTQTQFPGARVEWRFADHWTAEAFVEDRFAREGISGFGELGIRLSRVLGLSVFREWSY